MRVLKKLKNLLVRKFHEHYGLKFFLRKIGIEMPFYKSKHYYSTIPDVDTILTQKGLFEFKKKFHDIDLNIENQIKLLNQLKGHYGDLPFQADKSEGFNYYFDNPFFSYSDGTILFCMLAHFKPQRIIEIGSGFSTACMLDSIENLNLETHLTAIEPQTQRLLKLLSNSQSKNKELKILETNVQNVDIDIFKELGNQDLLFVDSSHIAKIGSDLNHIIFEILPILKEGVIVHFHDIFSQFEYPKEWIEEGIFLNEQYVLRAFLQNNNAFKILLHDAYMEVAFDEWYNLNMPLCLKPHERYAFGKNKDQLIPHIKGQSLYLIKQKSKV